MNLQVKGRNVDVTDALFSHAEKKLGKNHSRHLSDDSRCELELGVEHNPSIAADQVGRGDRVDKRARAARKRVVQDMYTSIDLVAEKLERQAKRYRNRRSRRAHHNAPAAPSSPPPEAPDLVRDEETAVIVKQKQFIMEADGRRGGGSPA